MRQLFDGSFFVYVGALLGIILFIALLMFLFEILFNGAAKFLGRHDKGLFDESKK